MLSVIEEATVDQKENENTRRERTQLFGATQSPPQAEDLLPTVPLKPQELRQRRG
jgi:hypothetical protein